MDSVGHTQVEEEDVLGVTLSVMTTEYEKV